MKTTAFLFAIQCYAFLLPLVSCIPGTILSQKDEDNESIFLRRKVTNFVEDQFKNWQNAADCQAFVDSFSDPFQYCDASPEGCLTTKDALYSTCTEMATLAGDVYSLHVKPLWVGSPVPLPNYLKIVVTGQQALVLKGDNAACFDFAIQEDLEVLPESDDITSHLWVGYYTMTLGKCSMAPPDKKTSLKGLLNWIFRKARKSTSKQDL